jgi:multidrug efflux system outer membrane protein
MKHTLSRTRAPATIVLTAAIAATAVTGCTTGPDYEGPPSAAAPSGPFSEIDDPAFVPGETDLRTWWTVFEDPMLNQIIADAAENAPDLRIAAARVQEARARLDLSRASRSPQIALGGGTAATGNTSSGFASGFSSSAAAEASWEIDLFGRLARGIEASEALFAAAEEDQRDVQVSLFAELATRYMSIRSLQAQIESATANINSQREILNLTRIRQRDGLASRLDVVRAEQLVAASEALLPPLRTQLIRDINTIAVLVGTQPSAIPYDLESAKPVPVPPTEIVVGIPADLLRQRPDIRAAERRIAAQSAAVGVATANLYPQFSFGGSIGTTFAGDPSLFSLGPSLRWTLFDGGRLRSQVSVEDAVLEQAIIAYERTVLRALEEVESAMTTFIEQRTRMEAVERSAEAAQEAFGLAANLYRDGLIDFQDLLDVQTNLLAADASVAEARGLATQNLVALYKALGGGWDTTEASPESGDPNTNDDETNPGTP